MGCYNETCMISNLPILPGESCIAILLASGRKLGRTCYADDKWKPISPPIFGTYNDDIGGLSDITPNDDLLRFYKDDKTFDAIVPKNDTHPGDEIHVSSFTPSRFTSRITYVRHNVSFETLDVLLKVSHENDITPGTLMFNSEIVSNDAAHSRVISHILIKKSMLDFARKHYAELAETTKNAAVAFAKTSTESAHSYATYQACDAWSQLLDNSNHDVLTRMTSKGIDLSDIVILQRLLGDMRMQWMPTSGAGSQARFDEPVQMAFSELLYETAKQMYEDASELDT